jgi:heat shock protein HtpX
MTTYDFISANKRRSVMLIAVFTAFVMMLCWFLDQRYQSGGLILVIGLVYSVGSALVGYYAGDKMALASSGAQEVTEKDNPYVVRMIQNLCLSTGTPMPRVHVINDDAINAFACGRDPQHASIAVTTGAIRKLENEELEGVLAHELSHVRNYDIRVMTLVIVLVGVVSIIADLGLRMSLFGRGDRDRESNSGPLALVGLVLIILSPLISAMVQMAVSRRREYLADASAALMTRFPEGLARALAKIQQDNRPMARESTATSHLFIANPLAGGVANLFSTHPPIEKRIEVLMKMANTH